MLDKEKAYSLLGLDVAATYEEVEKRYALLARKQRNLNEDGSPTGEPTAEEINDAYNFIRNAAREEAIRKLEPKNKTVARIGHFYEYYRWYVIGAIAAIALIIYMTTSIIHNRQADKLIAKADLKVSFYTEYDIQEPQPFEDKLLGGIPAWKDIYMVTQYSPTNPTDQYGMTMQQKAVVTMAAEKADLYIMDKANFDTFGRQGGFLDLTGQTGTDQIPADKRTTVDVEDEGTQWTAVDISDSPALKSLNLPAGEYYATVRGNAKKTENALEALEYLASEK
ncbi:hypothetical protein [Gorillibacterium massiliense]|uniref:hypothetical protein n=1 Tax=Gorillibacterium massiliense TaxID=1280390 RepID=UPI0004AD8D16|nr:hypothetical protein [Gorillibacterium massiliense]